MLNIYVMWVGYTRDIVSRAKALLVKHKIVLAPKLCTLTQEGVCKCYTSDEVARNYLKDQRRYVKIVRIVISSAESGARYE